MSIIQSINLMYCKMRETCKEKLWLLAFLKEYICRFPFPFNVVQWWNFTTSNFRLVVVYYIMGCYLYMNQLFIGISDMYHWTKDFFSPWKGGKQNWSRSCSLLGSVLDYISRVVYLGILRLLTYLRSRLMFIRLIKNDCFPLLLLSITRW